MPPSDDNALLKGYLPLDYGEVTSAQGVAPTRVGIVIPVFGRPGYLRRCLASLAKSRLDDCVVCLVDESTSDLSPRSFPCFEALRGLDSPGGDVESLPRTPLLEVAARAAQVPACLAFTNGGLVKSRLCRLPRPRSGLTIYIKTGHVPWWWRWVSRLVRPRRSPLATQLVGSWNPPGLRLVKVFKRRHGSMFDSYAVGWRLLAEAYGCELLMSLDADTLVKPDWLGRLVDLHDQQRAALTPLIVSGFNTPNHHTIAEQGHFCGKSSLGGVNLLFDRTVWTSLVEPTLNNLQWDIELSRRMGEMGGRMLACKPSVVQHIGRFGTWSSPLRFDHSVDF